MSYIRREQLVQMVRFFTFKARTHFRVNVARSNGIPIWRVLRMRSMRSRLNLRRKGHLWEIFFVLAKKHLI